MRGSYLISTVHAEQPKNQRHMLYEETSIMAAVGLQICASTLLRLPLIHVIMLEHLFVYENLDGEQRSRLIAIFIFHLFRVSVILSLSGRPTDGADLEILPLSSSMKRRQFPDEFRSQGKLLISGGRSLCTSISLASLTFFCFVFQIQSKQQYALRLKSKRL